MSGGFNPSPVKFGGQAGHREEIIVESLLEADGTAFSKDRESIVWAEREADARCIAYVWGLNRRLTLQRDPQRMTDFLPRWEKILGIVPPPTMSAKRRRAIVELRFNTDGATPDASTVQAALELALNGTLDFIVHTSSADSLGSVPGGTVVPGGVTLPDGDFRSTIAGVLVKVVRPAYLSDTEFYAIVAETSTALDDLLPAWVTFDWYLNGGSGAGFILDDEHNLDNEIFDV